MGAACFGGDEDGDRIPYDSEHPTRPDEIATRLDIDPQEVQAILEVHQN